MSEAERVELELIRLNALLDRRPPWYYAERERYNRCRNRSPWGGACILGCETAAPTICRGPEPEKCTPAPAADGQKVA